MNKKTMLVAITGVLLAVAGGAVGATFSRYQSTATATPTAQVAKWHVVVGNTEISKGESKDFTTTINWNKNENVAQGFFAPGMSGTITFTINASGTQVPIDYKIAINTNSIDSHKQIKIDSVTATTDSETQTETLSQTQTEVSENSINEYSGKIELDDIDKQVTITINVSWENKDEYNQDDTSLGVTGGEEGVPLDLPITFTANQRVSE